MWRVAAWACVLLPSTLAAEVHVLPAGDSAARQIYPTVAAARDALRQQRQDGRLQQGDVVELQPGVHAPFALDARDSGTPGARITYRGSATGPAVVSAGVTVPRMVCKERQASAGDPVVVCDLSSLRLNQSTTLGFRALALSFRGSPAILARYPNIGNGSIWNGTYQWLCKCSHSLCVFFRLRPVCFP